MIDFLKYYFSTPTYMLTPLDKLKMSGIVFLGLVMLGALIWGGYCLFIMIKRKK